MLATIGDYSQRIESGKRVEQQILDALRKKGHKIDPPTSREDTISKIDGWWQSRDGSKKFPLQVKFRQTGDDILYELIADIDRKREGRDIKSEASLYLVSDRRGKTGLYLTAPIKEKAKELVQIFEKEHPQEPFKTKWYGSGWEMKLQADRADGHRKLVAYFNPNLFEPLGVWELDIYE